MTPTEAGEPERPVRAGSTAPTATRGLMLHERLRYKYAAPVRQLHHQLIVVPPELHGDQRRLHHQISVTGTEARVVARVDGNGNQVVDVWAPSVDTFVEFDIRVVVHRTAEGTPTLVPLAVARRFSASSRLTQIDPAIADLAHTLAGGHRPGDALEFAERACRGAHAALQYAHDVTTVRTTAAEALGAGRGVCQDFAHLMVALCRAQGVPARYVSGHLVGEGGSHAWVEVMVTDPARPRTAVAVAFDPTHDRRTGDRYLTVAAGRDYGDVTPTSGTYEGSSPGFLSATKSLDVLEAEPGRTLVAS